MRRSRAYLVAQGELLLDWGQRCNRLGVAEAVAAGIPSPVMKSHSAARRKDQGDKGASVARAALDSVPERVGLERPVSGARPDLGGAAAVGVVAAAAGVWVGRRLAGQGDRVEMAAKARMGSY